jgi:hypothetical protein
MRDGAALVGLCSYVLAHRTVPRVQLGSLTGELDRFDEVGARFGGLGTHTLIVPHRRSTTPMRPPGV